MKNLSFSLFVISLFFFASCNKQPSASFKVDETIIKVNQSIVFTNTTMDGESYSWDFGDGINSAEQSPSHTYNAEGTYNVILTAYSKKQKKKDTYNMSITVYKPYQFTGTIDGSSISYIIDDENFINDFSNITTIYAQQYSKIYGTNIFSIDNVNFSYIEINLGEMPFNGNENPSVTEFNNYIIAKSYDYSAGPTNGVAITYRDANGKIWTTDFGSSLQAGSTFSISSVKTLRSLYGEDQIEFEANFSCTLYDRDGNSVLLKNGYMYSVFTN